MSTTRESLIASLEGYYKRCGWETERSDDGTVRATGLGGVTWIGLPVVEDDLGSPGFESRLLALSDQRMPGGELCPLELLPNESCIDVLGDLLRHLGLDRRGNVELYSLAA